MSLPELYRAEIDKVRYYAELRSDILSHQRRIAELREQVRIAEEEVEFHEVVLDLARNHQLIAAIGNLYNDSALSSTFANDPHRYCRETGIPLPEGTTLSPVDKDGPIPRLTARVRRGSWDMEVVWDREAGFFVRPYLPPDVSSS
jgi:hypothetical protein